MLSVGCVVVSGAAVVFEFLSDETGFDFFDVDPLFAAVVLDDEAVDVESVGAVIFSEHIITGFKTYVYSGASGFSGKKLSAVKNMTNMEHITARVGITGFPKK